MTRLELAMLAGAYAITNSRFGKNGVTYVNGVFSPNPEKIPFGEAAKVLSDTSCEQNVFVCPVKPGQTVYCVFKSGDIDEDYIRSVSFIREDDGESYWECYGRNDYMIANSDGWMIDCFPTREAAEKKLEELKS